MIKLEDFAKITMIKDHSCRSAIAKNGLPGVIIIEIKGGRPELIKAELEQYRPIGIEFDIRKMEE